MAEFCKKCADDLGFEPDAKPLLCEGCGLYFERVIFFKRFINFLKHHLR